jgi:PIN domain nuclease of toxin-antitoxin system
MNRLVLDTHIFVWFVNGDVRVGQQARAEINSIAKLGGVTSLRLRLGKSVC